MKKLLGFSLVFCACLCGCAGESGEHSDTKNEEPEGYLSGLNGKSGEPKVHGQVGF